MRAFLCKYYQAKIYELQRCQQHQIHFYQFSLFSYEKSSKNESGWCLAYVARVWWVKKENLQETVGRGMSSRCRWQEDEKLSRLANDDATEAWWFLEESQHAVCNPKNHVSKNKVIDRKKFSTHRPTKYCNIWMLGEFQFTKSKTKNIIKIQWLLKWKQNDFCGENPQEAQK